MALQLYQPLLIDGKICHSSKTYSKIQCPPENLLGLKGEGNTTRLTRDEPRSCMPLLGVESIAQLK